MTPIGKTDQECARFAGYQALARRILERACRDVVLRKCAEPDEIDAGQFLRSPWAGAIADLAGIDAHTLNNLLDYKLQQATF